MWNYAQIWKYFRKTWRSNKRKFRWEISLGRKTKIEKQLTICPKCGINYIQQESLDQHVKSNSSYMTRLNWEINFMEGKVRKLGSCPECGIFFKSLVSLERNMELWRHILWRRPILWKTLNWRNYDFCSMWNSFQTSR